MLAYPPFLEHFERRLGWNMENVIFLFILFAHSTVVMIDWCSPQGRERVLAHLAKIIVQGYSTNGLFPAAVCGVNNSLASAPSMQTHNLARPELCKDDVRLPTCASKAETFL